MYAHYDEYRARRAAHNGEYFIARNPFVEENYIVEPVNGVIAAVSVLASSESIFISTDFQRDCVQAEELSDQFPLMSTY